ncbi:MAG: MOSC domain-containing protein [Rubrobacter sp.]|nr:MOSC domain-containing protein [Rubrobacter sp.]
MGMHLSGLYVYPIKSCGGISLDTAEVDERSIRHDRCWMLVDEHGVFLSQREVPRLALIRVDIGADGLFLEAPGMADLRVPFAPEGETVLARVWDDFVETLRVGDEIDRWFSRFLGFSCRLVHLPDYSVRPVDPDYAEAGDRVGLSDGFPFLMISEASLDDLNGRMEHPLPMERFRPSLVVRGCGPFAEDGWRRVRVGGITFRVVKPCARCKITTVDQSSAEAGKEPLRTLATYRKVGSQVFFGQNLIHDSTGVLKIGDAVEDIGPHPA